MGSTAMDTLVTVVVEREQVAVLLRSEPMLEGIIDAVYAAAIKLQQAPTPTTMNACNDLRTHKHTQKNIPHQCRQPPTDWMGGRRRVETLCTTRRRPINFDLLLSRSIDRPTDRPCTRSAVRAWRADWFWRTGFVFGG